MTFFVAKMPSKYENSSNLPKKTQSSACFSLKCTNINQNYHIIFQTAVAAFLCPEGSKIEHLKELESYLLLIKEKYEAIKNSVRFLKTNYCR